MPERNFCLDNIPLYLQQLTFDTKQFCFAPSFSASVNLSNPLVDKCQPYLQITPFSILFCQERLIVRQYKLSTYSLKLRDTLFHFSNPKLKRCLFSQCPTME